MKVNLSSFSENASDSIINMQWSDNRDNYFFLQKSYWEALRFSNLTSLQAFKKVFGKQKITKNYINRNWIWTFSSNDGKGIIYCLVSKEGPSWEYDSSSDLIVIEDLFEEVMTYLIDKLWNKK